MATQITLPKDAEGKEVPLDTELLYDEYGNQRRIMKFIYHHDCETGAEEWTVEYDNGVERFVSVMYLTQPDSWEKLLDDLDNAANGGDNAECLYMRREDIEVGEQCSGCRLYETKDDFTECSYLAYSDIAARIRRLRGEDE